ncbi:MAG: pitrilysin family protein [Candidatus Eisenbacteria bacterium]
MRSAIILSLVTAALAVAGAPDADAARRPARKASVPARVSSAPSLSPERFKVERHRLDNGLVVLTREDHSVPAVAFWQWFKVGSRNERPGITGLSHFFEHMMFNGSKNVPPKEYDRILESNGGYGNAFTSRDMTAYYEELAADRLDVALRVDSDRMANLSLLPDLLKSEIEVVKEERRMSVDDNISGMLGEALWATAFAASPYRWPVIGSMKDLKSIPREEMVKYFRTYYAPNNCILVLVGDFKTGEAVAKIRAAFGGIPAQPLPPAPVYSEPEQLGERRIEVRYPAETETFVAGYKAPGVRNPDVFVLDVISSILSDGESSRLHRALVYESQIALEVSTSFDAQLEPGLFECFVKMKPGLTARQGEAVLDSVLRAFVQDGPSPRELQKAKNLLEAGFIKELKTNNGVGQTLAHYEHLYGDYRKMFEAMDRYRAVTAEDCKRVAAAIFDPRRRTIAEVLPEQPAKPVQGGGP